MAVDEESAAPMIAETSPPLFQLCEYNFRKLLYFYSVPMFLVFGMACFSVVGDLIPLIGLPVLVILRTIIAYLCNVEEPGWDSLEWTKKLKKAFSFLSCFGLTGFLLFMTSLSNFKNGRLQVRKFCAYEYIPVGSNSTNASHHNSVENSGERFYREIIQADM